MVAMVLTALVMAATLIAEWRHVLRCRRVAALAWGPSRRARRWTVLVPPARAAGLGMVIWGCATLLALPSGMPSGGASGPEETPRRLLIVYDVSPSMYLQDAGPRAEMTRSERARALMLEYLGRLPAEKGRFWLVAFATEARVVAEDVRDLGIVGDLLDGLLFDKVFPPGKTDVTKGLSRAWELAKNKDWQAGSAAIILMSDGDFVPGWEGVQPPPAIAWSLVVGVGSREGRPIDDHISRLSEDELAALASRLSSRTHPGRYCDGNVRGLPDDVLAWLAEGAEDPRGPGPAPTGPAVTALACGATLLGVIPVVLGWWGTAWRIAPPTVPRR
jgi:Ca-activated chloride channel family protein